MEQKAIINDLTTKFESIINNAKNELLTIKTGKANPSLVENMIVDAYQNTVKLKLRDLASISTKDNQTLTVTPFDMTVSPDIEKAIRISPLHFSCRVESKTIYIIIPPLSEEQRNIYVKLISQIIENSKNKLRTSRDDIRKHIKTEYENKTLTQDNKYRLEKEVDDLIKKYTEKHDELKDNKQQELLTI